MKKVLFIGGVFAQENEAEILENSKTPVEYSANIFQKKLIHGFLSLPKEENAFQVISAPFIGSYPNAYKKMFFKGFQEEQTDYQYVHFNNIWGIRNLSRTRALKKAVRAFAKEKQAGVEKLIVVYSPHTPFLAAAVWAKKKDPSIRICLIVPDLPQYMNLSEKKSLLYRVGKKFDIRKFNTLNKQVDTYVLLTEAMKEKIDTCGKPCRIVEGIVTEAEIENSRSLKAQAVKDDGVKYVVYTGKVYRRFGAIELVDAFMKTTGKTYRLVICGDGDGADYVREAAKKDERILFQGQVSSEKAKEWMYKADVLVNPRGNNEEYTKYSFPSKNIEYLLSGAPVVAYKLDGMKAEYEDMLYVPREENAEALAAAMEQALSSGKPKDGFETYCKQFLLSKTICENVVNL